LSAPVLVAPEGYEGRFSAAEVAAAVAAGLRKGGRETIELPLADRGPADPGSVLGAAGFDDHMRAAAFVVTGEGRLDDQALAGTVLGEVATRCRQSGVTCHAVVGEDALEPFKARILDLASVTEARTLAELEAAGRALA
jgi:glycerate kinase